MKRMRHALVAVGCLLSVVGCSPQVSREPFTRSDRPAERTAAASVPATAAPEQVVAAYLDARSEGAVEDANVLMWRSGDRPRPVSAADDFMVGLKDVEVHRARAADYDATPEFPDVVSVSADFVTVRDSVAAGPPGPKTRFFTLARQSRSPRWRILGMGTGP